MMFRTKCRKCGEVAEYCYLDIKEEQTKDKYKEYIECPKCSNNILINSINTNLPYLERESVFHCLTCGEKLTMRVDRIDEFSWFVCKKCEAKYNEKG